MIAEADVLITALVTVTIALAGYWITYLNNLRLSQRKERLTRVNRQLAELYGPLFALSNASRTIWNVFTKEYVPYNSPEGRVTTETWRLWISTVFMPINLRMYELVLAKADLLIESTMPKCLLELCAHIAAYQAVMKRWERNDFSEYTPLIAFPSEVEEYARESFQALKAEQAKLMGKK